jgi:predicted membrane protein
MKPRQRTILTRIHFTALSLAVLNSISKIFTSISLADEIAFAINLVVVVSGLILFFFYLKPYKTISFYFSFYAFAATLVIIGFVFRGIFGALILSIILSPIIPNEKEYVHQGVTISTPFQGFISPCCSYQVKERKFLIFEKDYGIFELNGEGPINFESVHINLSNTEIEITYSTIFDQEIEKKKIISKDKTYLLPN